MTILIENSLPLSSIQSKHPIQIVLNNRCQISIQSRLIRINRQLQSIKTSMSLRIRILLIKHRTFYQEFSIVSSIALQFPINIKFISLLEPVDWSPWWSSTKMQQSSKLLLIHHQHLLPKPLYHLMILMIITLIIRIISPILSIYKRHSIQYHLHLIRLEHTQQLLRDYLMKSAFHELYWSMDWSCCVHLDAFMNVHFLISLVDDYLWTSLD